MAQSIKSRLDTVIDHLAELKAEPKAIVLTSADYQEFREEQQDSVTAERYRDIPLRHGQIGGSSYIEAEGTPGGATNFGV